MFNHYITKNTTLFLLIIFFLANTVYPYEINYLEIEEKLPPFPKDFALIQNPSVVVYEGNELYFNPSSTAQTINSLKEVDFGSSNFYSTRAYGANNQHQYYFNLALQNFEKCEAFFSVNQNYEMEFSLNENLDQSTLKTLYNRYRKELELFGIRINREVTYIDHDDHTHTQERYYVIKIDSTLSYKDAVNPLTRTAISGLLTFVETIPTSLSFLPRTQTQTTVAESWNNCGEYNENYKNGVEYLRSYSSILLGQLREEIIALMNTHKELDYIGVCDENYTWKGSSICRKIEEELYSIQQDQSLTYNNILFNIEKVNLGEFSGFNGLLYNTSELIKRIKPLRKEANQTLSEMTVYVENSEVTINNYLEDIRELIEELRNEKIYLIDGFYSNQTNPGELNIKNKFYDLENKLYLLEEEARVIKNQINNRERGWLAQSYSRSQELISELIQTKEEVLSLRSTSISTVEKFREIVLNLIEKLEGEGIDLSGERELITKGDNAKDLGTKFTYYREALSSILYITQFEGNTLIQMYEELKESLPSLIERAKIDQIDVSSEEAQLSYYLSLNNKSLAVKGMIEIRDSIITKATLQYGDLGLLRKKLYSYLDKNLPITSEIKAELMEKENGVVFNGRIDFERGIGKLRELYLFYINSISEIENTLPEVLENTLEVESYFNIPYYEEEETEINGYISIFNPSTFEVEGTVETYSPIKPNSPEVVAYNNCIATLRVKVGPYETKVINVNEVITPIRITNTNIEVTGKDGTTYIKKELLIETRVCGNRIKLDDDYDKVSSNEFRVEGSYLVGEFSPGFYYAKVEKQEENGYSIKVTSRSLEKTEEGIFEKIEYEINTNRKHDYIDIEGRFSKAETTKEFKLFTDKIRIYDVVGTEKVILFRKISSEESEIIRLEQLLRLNNLTQEEEIELETILNIENPEEKLEQLLELYGKVEERIEGKEKEEYLEEKIRSNVEKEIELVRKGIVCAQNNNIPYLEESYRERLNFLEQKISTINNSDEKILKEIEKELNKERNWLEKTHKRLVSDAIKDFTKSYKGYVKLNIPNTNISSLSEKFEYYIARYNSNPKDPENVCNIIKIKDSISSKVSFLSINIKEEKTKKIKELGKEAQNLTKEVTLFISKGEKILGKETLNRVEQIKKRLDKINKELSKGEKANLNYVENEIETLKYEADLYKRDLENLAVKTLNQAKTYFESIKDKIREEDRKALENALLEAEEKLENNEFLDAIRLSKNVNNYKPPKQEELPLKEMALLGVIIVLIVALYLKESKKKKNEKKERKIKLKRITDSEETE